MHRITKDYLSLMITNPDEHKKNISSFFSQRSDYWVKLYGDESNPSNFTRYELASRKRTVFKQLGSVDNNNTIKVLDIGCGIGNYMEELIQRGYNVTGVDVSINMLQISKGRLQKYLSDPPLSLADIEKLPFIDSEFDIILCVGVLEYLKTDDKAIKEISRILKPGGRTFLTLPNIISIKNFLDPYYFFSRGFKFISRKIFSKKKPRKLNIELKDIALNSEFTNRRFLLRQLNPLFLKNNLSTLNTFCVSFGPPRFWLKDYLPLKTSIKISNSIISISNIKIFSFIKYLANRWVICLQKSS